MADVLVYEVFRNANGSLATNTNVKVTLRNNATVLRDLTTDGLGTVDLYLPPGSYDWIVRGDRTPFDVVAPLAGGSDTYTHPQASAAAQWSIPHLLGTKPDVRLFLDSDLTERVYTDVIYTDLDHVLVDWPSPVSGVAYLK